jgi:hypothetical protein
MQARGWSAPTWLFAGACNARLWFELRPDPDTADGQPFYHVFQPPLGPSVGTKVRNYRAFCRGIDFAGMVEKTFENGRNASTFEVTG